MAETETVMQEIKITWNDHENFKTLTALLMEETATGIRVMAKGKILFIPHTSYRAYFHDK